METLKRALRFQTVKKIWKVKNIFENIHENYVPNVKDHVLSTFVTRDNEVRVVPNTSLCHLFVSEFHSEEEKKALE